MARTNIAAQSPSPLFKPYYPPSGGLSALAADLVLTLNTDPTDRSTALIDGKTMVLAYNTDTLSHTITIGSAPDTLNRSGDITTYAVAAGKVSVFGPFPAVGWANAGLLNIDVTDSHLVLAVITLP